MKRGERKLLIHSDFTHQINRLANFHDRSCQAAEKELQKSPPPVNHSALENQLKFRWIRIFFDLFCSRRGIFKGKPNSWLFASTRRNRALGQWPSNAHNYAIAFGAQSGGTDTVDYDKYQILAYRHEPRGGGGRYTAVQIAESCFGFSFRRFRIGSVFE